MSQLTRGLKTFWESNRSKLEHFFKVSFEIGKGQFPDKKQYRYPAPANQASPDFTLNFPVKTETLSNQRYAERIPRLADEAHKPETEAISTANPNLSTVPAAQLSEVMNKLPSNPKVDPRNVWLNLNTTPQMNLHFTRVTFEELDVPRFHGLEPALEEHLTKEVIEEKREMMR